jgi:RNA polymerase sigma-70 factor (ECF subfamily)
MLQDEQILDLYWSRDDAAIDKTSEKYGGQLQRLADRMLRAKEDAEECVNDTYLAAWNAIPPQKPPLPPARRRRAKTNARNSAL